MRRLLYFLFLISILVSCKNQAANKAQISSECTKQDSGRGIYFWKTKFNLNDYELRFLKEHDITRLYVKFFDVALDNHSSDDTLSIVPIATTRFESGFPEDIEIVPTVYITYEVLAHLKGKDIEVSFDRPTALQIDGETVVGVNSYRAVSHSLKKETEPKEAQV